jgi:hypothetical protein
MDVVADRLTWFPNKPARKTKPVIKTRPSTPL